MLTLFASTSFLLSGASAQARDYTGMWKKFKLDHNKKYEANGEDESRFEIFKANVDIIDEHNSKDSSYKLGVNAFADLTSDEFAGIYTGGYLADMPRRMGLPFPNMSLEDAPEAVDWVNSGAVTDVKNQGRCGSCWAFSTTGALEGAYFVANKKLISLSEEDLVDCDTKGDKGCQGGLMDHAFGWVKKNGICSEDDYPYTAASGKSGKCHTPKCKPAVTIEGFVDVPHNDEKALQAAVAQQPVSVAIEADKSVFQLYKSGIISSRKCGKSLDHGVLVVGYGTDNGKDYWKVKNSWGASWGEQGYVRMMRGKNMCGIAMQPSYPKGAKPMMSDSQVVSELVI